jgi:hypothetical protein
MLKYNKHISTKKKKGMRNIQSFLFVVVEHQLSPQQIGIKVVYLPFFNMYHL